MQLASPTPPPSAANSRRANGIGFLRLITAEPAMFLFMCSSLAKFPIFQSLLYEKACLNSGRFNGTTCQNITATHADLALQTEANHLLLASSFCLLLPSIPMALLLGALFDSWSSQKSLLIPLAGLFLADLNYILQSFCSDCSAYWLLLSDLFYGFAGGFTAIIGLLFAFSVRVSPPAFRSTRFLVALMEGSMGLGGMCGYIISGHLRQNFGYAWVFLFLTFLHLLLLLYVLFFVREVACPPPASSSALAQEGPNTAEQAELDSKSKSSNSSSNQGHQSDDGHLTLAKLFVICHRHFLEIIRFYRAEREPNVQKCLNIVLAALAVELTCFSGLMDILFSFLRFQLKWTDKEYGWFNGISTGLASFAVLLLYPLLQKRVGISNLRLVLFGLLTKIVSVLILTFTKSTVLAMISILPAIFGRFVSAGLRAMASKCVGQHEQGKVFSLISLLEAMAFLVASLFFNGLYPYTLRFFPGLMLIVIVVLLLIPVGLLVYMDVKKISGKTTTTSDELSS